MKILIINHEFPPIGGGAAYASEVLAKYLVSSGHEVEIVTSSISKAIVLGPERIERNNYKVKRILSLRRSQYSGKIYELILFAIHGILYSSLNLKRIKSDIVYAFFTLPAGILGLFIKKIYKIPYFVFLRGIDVPGFYGGRFSFLNKILKPVIKQIWINADKVIANSQALKNLANKTMKDKPIYVIPNIVDTEFFHPPDTLRNRSKLKLIYVGRLNRQKGLDYLLKAFSLVTQDPSGSFFFLEIVGDGPEKNNLLKMSYDLKINQKINFVSWACRKDLLQRYQSADIFISVSLDEGMPNAVMEAMACGLPIIASDIPAHRELIEQNKNGLLVALGNSQELAESIKRLIENKALRERMRAGSLEKIKARSLQNAPNYSKYLEI